MADQRQRIISSVFSRRNAAGDLEETYVSHVKIWEDAGPEGGGRKPRYILLSLASNNAGFIHKSKLNTNGTYSVGKTWRVSELRGIEVVNPLAFNITLARTYRWQTEAEADQARFVDALVLLHRSVVGHGALQIGGVAEPMATLADFVQTSQPAPRSRPGRASPAIIHQPLPQAQTHNRLTSQVSRELPRGSSPQPRPNGLPSRPTSPASTIRGLPSSLRPGQRTNSPSPTISNAIPARQPPQRPQVPPPQVVQVVQFMQDLAGRDRQSQRLEPEPSPIPITQSLYERRPSPAPSAHSHKPLARPPAESTVQKRDQNARISFFDPANQITLDRVLASDMTDGDGEDGDTQATMASVEEMLEGYEWASDDVIGRKTGGGAGDLIEARLLDELMALEKANIHSFLESDDRITVVLKYMDDALSELENMDNLISSYKIHLNAVGDDISYIQSQNRGLQVQTQNQRVLLGELENLLRTVNVDKEALVTLTQESLEKSQSIGRLEDAATQLYKALQAGRDTEMSATMARLEEYRTHNAQFCKRMYDFLSIMFIAQSRLLLGDTEGLRKTAGNRQPTTIPHQDLEEYLGRYAGLMLYLKEMDEETYVKLCGSYFSAASDLHGTQIRALLTAYIELVRKAPEEENETLSSTTAQKGNSTLRRAGTLMRSPMDVKHRDREKTNDADAMKASEVFGLVLEQIATLIRKEDAFITDFLQTSDVALTFADYMSLDNYFRRQAARAAGPMEPNKPTMKLMRQAMDLTFGFLPAEVKKWLDLALARDSMEVIGIMVTIERFLLEGGERGNQFLSNLLGRQHTRLKGLLERHFTEQIKGIEQTKLTSKKRKGVATFVKQFPHYLGRVENHLVGADGLQVRQIVNDAYDKIVQTMFDCLKQMAKMDGEGEDKGQLYYHVILIENMHHFVTETSQQEVGSVAGFLRKAQGSYEENMGAYVKLVMRRPFAKIIDFFEGVEKILKNGSPSDVASNSNYNKSQLKKVIKEFTVKDIRKIIDSLYKRVEKHFTEGSDDGGGVSPGTVLVSVWKACENELVRITELFSKRISQCYGDSGFALEYTVSDVETAFKRHRIGF